MRNPLTKVAIQFPYQRLLQALTRFGSDTRGNIALIFGLSAVMIFTSMGAGLDLSRAYLARQKLSEVATLACQYASRPAIVDTSTASYNGTGGGTTYSTQVTNFITTAWQNQNISLTQTNGTPFTYTQGGPANVTLAASVPTTFMQIAGFSTIPLQVQVHCYDTPSSVLQRVPDGNSQIVMQETFAATPNGPVSGWASYLPNGSSGTQSNATGYTSAVGYTGASGVQWHIEGYCLEQDQAGTIKTTTIASNYSVELDCDNGSTTNDKGNSSISTLTYLPAGSYELRYNYASRVNYPSYEPTYLCGSSASDLDWANSSTTSWSGSMASAYRTNQINVYLDLNPANNQPPQHTTLDGTEQLAGSNLIDMCLYGQSWIQRSVSINVTTAGYYWLSFAADGGNDSFGGSIDDIMLCQVSCSGSVQDNYTTAWAVSSLLFDDTFESPVYSGSPYNTSGNVNNSYGSSYFWDEEGNGWANAPTNQLPYWNDQCPQATQCIELGWGTNSLVSKPFLFVPGYYQISYKYQSEIVFSSGVSDCSASPVTSTTLPGGSGSGKLWNTGSSQGTVNYDTNAVAMLMSHGQMASTPDTGNSLGSTTSYTNPSGTVTTTPTYPPNSTTSPSTVSLLDVCSYSATEQTRTATVFIEKAAWYWLTLAALGTSDAHGGIVDDVQITALGSPYMSSPPSGAVTIPVPSPQPGSTLSFTGFSITADPLTPD
jgi:Flp pilus assembly protein TadG